MTSLPDDRILEISKSIMGWLDPRESVLLYQLAQNMPYHGVIVEVGSYRGRSTVLLALGAREQNGTVYAVDPFEGMMDGREVTLHDRDQLENALAENGVRDDVHIWTQTSLSAAKQWSGEIDLIFIDGSHQYEDVMADLKAWSPWVTGKIAMHDTLENGQWQGVVQALNEFVAAGEWAVVQRADATTVLERVAVADKVARVYKGKI